MEKESPDDLCPVYCPACGRATDKVSLKLLREAGEVAVHCSCGGITYLRYTDNGVEIRRHDYELEIAMAKNRRQQTNRVK